eukprot:m.225091 g.225091  ORF g.225091 m.225091 type:complete len:136 (-) comp15953_c0_seq1:1484-1891(-)
MTSNIAAVVAAAEQLIGDCLNDDGSEQTSQSTRKVPADILGVLADLRTMVSENPPPALCQEIWASGLGRLVVECLDLDFRITPGGYNSVYNLTWILSACLKYWNSENLRSCNTAFVNANVHIRFPELFELLGNEC